MFQKVINTIALRKFHQVELNSNEASIADAAVNKKYSKALENAFFYCVLSVFPILFLDTQTLISVLIPITMVSGTAWFSISLANMKQKFDNFWLELTTNLFEAFTISLGLLFMLAAFSFWWAYIEPLLTEIPYQSSLEWFAVISGIVIVGNIIYKIFIGSIQYDINDAMLTGQNETAEKFFRKSLSNLHSLSESLKSKSSLQVSNYYIGVAFFEIFSHIEKYSKVSLDTQKYIDIANTLIQKPSMTQEEADKIAVNLIQSFVSACIHPQWFDSHKSISLIQNELQAISNNKDEDQEMVDTRFWVIFIEISNLLESQGETLFKKS